MLFRSDDGDNDDNGAAMAGHGVVSRAVTLTAGDEPTDDGDSDANTNLSVDFGFSFMGTGDLSLGDTVWYDADNDGLFHPETESGIDGVVVRLYADSDGSGDYTPDEDAFLRETRTVTRDEGQAGTYVFADLPEGDYIV